MTNQVIKDESFYFNYAHYEVPVSENSTYDLKTFTPREIVNELDRYIVGQDKAKRAVAIALRNRWRRRQVDEALRDEIAPKNIILIGPTGVGKTEIARRIAKLSHAPFVKVEASKFTEVGYVGRDVDSIIRDLVEVSVKMIKDEETQKVETKASQLAEERILDLLLPPVSSASNTSTTFSFSQIEGGGDGGEIPAPDSSTTETREKFRKMLRDGKLNDRYVELEVSNSGMPMMQIFSNAGLEEMGISLNEMMSNLPFGGKRKKKRNVKIPEAMKIIKQEEAGKLVDIDKVVNDAITRAEQGGIVFIDEIDKIASREGGGRGPDVSREGVQRDLLPVVEGCTVTTKYGVVKTDHILFIAAGAFHVSKVSDLIPELQGRFPIRVELQTLSSDDFVKILTEPKNSLVKQYYALLATEGLKVEISTSAIREIAETAANVNSRMENIGARRLHTIMESLFEDISFRAPEMTEKNIHVDVHFVRDKMTSILENDDLSKYIL